MMIDQLVKEFSVRYNKQPEHVYFCPGRVNLIGEHIDYNGGKVMPCAISLGTYLAVSGNADHLLRFESLAFEEKNSFPIQSSYTKTGSEWYNYPLGVFNELSKKGHQFSGLDMLFSGDLPIGASLSSSASIEVLMSFALSDLFDLPIPKKEIAILSRRVENDFIGVSCGIMDQYAVAMGREGHAILLDCDTIQHDYLPLQLGDYLLAIINTNRPRKLTDSKYNERYAQCMLALKTLQTVLPVNHLCDITPSQFNDHRHLINDPVIAKRAEHVIMENERVKDAETALKQHDLVTFGKLMYASHDSLQHLYEVSGIELDTIAAFGKTYDDCIGARMTGAGFGGCAIALVKKDKIRDFTDQLTTYYTEKIGYAPSIFSSLIGEGVRELKR